MSCYYCEQPLGKSRKRAFTNDGIKTFHKSCYRQMLKEQRDSQLSEVRAERLNEQALYGYELVPSLFETQLTKEVF